MCSQKPLQAAVLDMAVLTPSMLGTATLMTTHASIHEIASQSCLMTATLIATSLPYSWAAWFAIVGLLTAEALLSHMHGQQLEGGHQ